MRAKRDRLIAAAFLGPYAVASVTFLGVPLLVGIALSLTRTRLLGPPPIFVGLANYAAVLRDDLFWAALGNTLCYMALIVPVGTGISLSLAGALSLAGRGSGALRTALYLPSILGVSVVAILWRWLYASDGGLINTLLQARIPWLSHPSLALSSISVLTLWWTYGGSMLVYLAAIKGVPQEVIESAKLDGAKPGQVALSIVMPCIKPTVVFCTALSCIGTAQIFGQIYVVTGGSGGPAYSTLSLSLAMFQQGFSSYQLGFGSAMAIVIFVFIALTTAGCLGLLELIFPDSRKDLFRKWNQHRTS